MSRVVRATSGDVVTIVQKVRSGEIPREVITQAHENRRNPNRTYCVFFTKDRTCGLGKARPLECLRYGTAYEARGTEKYQEAIEVLGDTGEDIGVPFRECSNIDACALCVAIQFVQDRIIPLQDIDDSNTIVEHFEDLETYRLENILNLSELQEE